MRTAWLALMLLLALAPSARATDWAAYVDPFIGTGPAPSASYGLEFDGGDVFPGATYPAGMLYWSPDTVEHRIPGGYYHPDRTIKGFSLTHFSGRGCTVYQDVPIMPVLDGAPSTFSHANESASPGAYGVMLDSGIQVDLTVTPRTGLGRVTWPANTAVGTLAIDAAGSVNTVFDSDINVDPARQLVTGHVTSQVGCGTDRYTLYFAIVFDHPFIWTATSAGASLTFDATTPLELKPAVSYVSVDNALANLAAEGGSWDIDSVRAIARSAWNDVLQRIQITSSDDRDLRVFYTALYHAFLHPNLFSDANGDYIGFDDRVHQVADGHAHYHNIPGWDQYRSLAQLRSILAPAQMSDIIQSLVDDAAQGGGGMPRWEQANRNSAGMVGDSPGAYVASAYAFGARDFALHDALVQLDYGASNVDASSGGHVVREYLSSWLRLRYVPDQPSITLEYAIDDFAIAQFASALGEDALHDRYAARAMQWRNTFNPATGSAASRDAEGRFHECCGFVEGNAAQYTWMVPFDFPGLVSLLGGDEPAVARLDSLFTLVNSGPDRPNAWMGNEPSLWSPWAYNVAGAPSRTQQTVRRIQRELFLDAPGGLPGNDDGGATSAWYVFSALGLYPLVPGVGGFTIGSPLFEDARVQLPSGGVLRIVGHNAAPDYPYVTRLTLDGADVTGTWLDWTQIANGATLEFWLAPEHA